MIIDFHAHLIRDMITKQYDVEDCLSDMEKNHINKRVISTLEGKSTRDQNDFIASLVDQYPDRFIGCAAINPKEDDCVEEVKRLTTIPQIKILEFDPWEHGFLPERYSYHLDQIFEIAQEHGFIIKMFAGWGPRTMPEQWTRYCLKFPDLTFVVLHIGGIDFGYGAIDFIEEMPNVMTETSDQTEIQVLHKAFKKLPIQKMLFGSNYPKNFTKCSIDTFDCLHLSKEDQAYMFYKNAEALFKK